MRNMVLLSSKDSQASEKIPVLPFRLDTISADKPTRFEIVFIENIGNLVCPANYDLGEDVRVIILSVAEGDDKPAKYPGIFVKADAVVINKIDLLPYVDCSISAIREGIIKINSTAKIFELSCKTQKGLDAWLGWLRQIKRAKGGS